MIGTALNKLGTGENFLNTVNCVYEKPTANITLAGRRLKAVP